MARWLGLRRLLIITVITAALFVFLYIRNGKEKSSIEITFVVDDTESQNLVDKAAHGGIHGIKDGADHVNVTRDPQPTLVLIVAYYRSGSTLTGSLLDENKDAFYFFEPLFPFYLRTTKHGLKLKYFNGTSRQSPNETKHEDIPIATDILSSILDCRFSNVDVRTWTDRLCDDSITGNSSRDFCHCKLGKSSKLVEEVCFPNYTRLCAASKLRAIKTIRVNMEVVGRLLLKYPDLKVIHLLRDPRGMFRSQSGMRESITEEHIQGYCRLMTQSIKDRLQLEKTYPRNFKEIIYEDLVADPIGVAEGVYYVLNHVLPEYIKESLHKKILSGAKNDGLFGTTRTNALETAYKWTTKVSWQTIKYTHKHCTELLLHGKFPMFNTKDELHNFTVPDRRKHINALAKR